MRSQVMARVHTTTWSLLLAVGGATACGGLSPGPGSGIAVRDSLGIQVVENESPELGPGAWRVTPDPVLQIGSSNGAGPEPLLRVSDAVNLTDGRIAVLDAGTNQLRLYSISGELLRAEGRRGNGPGEFDVPWTLQELPGDSVQVFDLANGRISVFDEEGGFVRAVTLRPAGGQFYVGVLSDGHHLAYHGTSVVDDGGVRTTGRHRETSTLARYSPDGAITDIVGRLPGLEVFVFIGNGTAREMAYPFGSRRLNVLHEDLLTVGYTDRYELFQFAEDGRVARVIRRAAEPLLVTDEDRALYRETSLYQLPPDILSAIAFPENHPVLGSLITDDDGNLWVEEYRKPGSDGPSRWSVFDERGRWLTDVEVPERFQIMHIAADRLLGVWRDEREVEYVRVYALAKDG